MDSDQIFLELTALGPSTAQILPRWTSRGWETLGLEPGNVYLWYPASFGGKWTKERPERRRLVPIGEFGLNGLEVALHKEDDSLLARFCTAGVTEGCSDHRSDKYTLEIPNGHTPVGLEEIERSASQMDVPQLAVCLIFGKCSFRTDPLLSTLP